MTTARMRCPVNHEPVEPPSTTDSLAAQAKTVSASAAAFVTEAARTALAGVQSLGRSVAAAKPAKSRARKPTSQRPRKSTSRKRKPARRRAA
jgi:hypothetical protein